MCAIEYHTEEQGSLGVLGEFSGTSKEQLSVFFEETPDVCYLMDLQGVFINGNRAAEELCGWHKEELIGRTFMASGLLGKKDLARSAELLQRNRCGEATGPDEFQLLRRDGSPIAVELRTRPVEFDGEIYVLGIARDISARKQVEAALRDTTEKFRGIVDNIGIGIAVISSDMKILDLNRQMREWFPEANTAKSPHCYRALNIPPREGPCSYCPTIKTLQDGQVHEDTTDTPRPDGVRNYRIVSSPVRDAEGKVIAAIEMVEDVTARLSLEAQLRASQRLESVGQLAGGVAHDFNNILTGIIGYTEFALQKVATDSQISHDLREVQKLGWRAETLTRQLLAFSRKQILNPVILNINGLVEELTKMLRRLIGEHIDLAFHHASDLGNVKADPSQIEQVLMNLALNARDAMPQGGKLTIETANVTLDEDYARQHEGARPGEYVMLAVSDTGMGMDAATCERAFEPFFTTKDSGRGTGLGLAMVYGIIRQHNGNIWVYSEPEKGTAFKVYLPRVDQATTLARILQSQDVPRGSETVLILEDEVGVRAIASRLLESLGYSILTAAKPSEAEKILAEKAGDIHVLLTDVMLPECNGRSFSEATVAKYPHIRVVYMSGYTDNGIVHHAVLDQGTAFVQKPFTQGTLAHSIRKVLDG